MTDDMTGADRDALIKLVKARARQAVSEAKMREKVLLAEVADLITAEFEAGDALWADAVAIAEEYAAKANAQIQARCAELGIPPKDAPGLGLGWHPRSSSFENANRRGELRQLAEKRLTALTETAKVAINGAALRAEEALVIGGLQSDQARAMVEALPTVETLMPALSLADLGVKHWQPPEDAASQLISPLTTTQRRARQILRAIEANPRASDREIAKLVACDHKTVAAHRGRGGTPRSRWGTPHRHRQSP
jgi:hypothetical protein